VLLGCEQAAIKYALQVDERRTAITALVLRDQRKKK